MKPLAWLRGKEIWRTDARDDVAGKTDRHNCFYDAVKQTNKKMQKKEILRYKKK